MARNLPAKPGPALSFLEARIDAWAKDPPAIGLTAEQVDLLSQEIAAARLKHDRALEIRAQSVSATADFRAAAQAMHAAAASMILNIKAAAAAAAGGAGGAGGAGTDPDAVYARAQLSPPAPRTRAGAPTPATDLRAALRQDGTVELSWTATLAKRTFFAIHRRLDDEPELSHIASVGHKRFVDTDVPEQTRRAEYCVRAIRGERVSAPTNPAIVQIGATPVEGEQRRAA